VVEELGAALAVGVAEAAGPAADAALINNAAASA
jgi:hypothetical protein